MVEDDTMNALSSPNKIYLDRHIERDKWGRKRKSSSTYKKFCDEMPIIFIFILVSFSTIAFTQSSTNDATKRVKVLSKTFITMIT